MSCDIGIDKFELKYRIIEPTLELLGICSESLVDLLLCTAAVESGLGYRLDVPHNGLGLYRVHPKQHQQVWDTYLNFEPKLAGQIKKIREQHIYSLHPHLELDANPQYATAIVAANYLAAPFILEATCELDELATIWTQFYPSVIPRSQMYFHQQCELYVAEVLNCRDLASLKLKPSTSPLSEKLTT